MFWGNFFEKVFCPVFQGGSSLRNVFKKSKNLQKSKNAQNCSQKCQNVFWTSFGVIFSRNFFAQCSKEGPVFEMSLENLQNSKNAQNRSQKCPNVFWTCFEVIFSRKFFCPVFQGGSSLRNVFKKLSKFKKRPQSFPICPNVFWTSFGVIFLKNFFAQCSKECRVFEMFLKNFQNWKNAQNRSQFVQACFEQVLG